MPHLVVPRAASSSSVALWLAAVNEPTTRVELRINGAARPVSGAWSSWSSSDGVWRLRHQTLSVAGLPPRRPVRVELWVGVALASWAETATLPDRLPRVGERPLTVMLGSCFCRSQDKEGAAGWSYSRLPHDVQPDLKILCGDQVYLDSPAARFVLGFRKATLERECFANYWKTWTHEDGFQQILRRGPNWFLADDHEFWNDAPNRSFPRNSWMQSGREHWRGLATELYRIFQNAAATSQLDVAPLSFFFADTRVNREEGRSAFMKRTDLAKLGDWVDGLTAPGVLVIGQPVFVAPGGLLARTADLGLADFTQYADLVAIFLRAKHSILVLTGDVHFGRIAWCRLPSGAELVEVISSPLALVSDLAGGKWKAPPDRFPADAIGTAQVRIEHEAEYDPHGNHFLTLELASKGGEIELGVRHWSFDGKSRGLVATKKLR